MIITLTTDFGLSDPFVGIMKGVMLGITPAARLIDISHDVRSYDVFEAAALIQSAYPYFPPGTVHLIVVDPGVGSARRPLAAAARGHIFVAPDNGVLSCVLIGEWAHEVFEITDRSLFLNPVSQTFHGRDIFAPVAAHLAAGVSIDSVGPRITDFVRKPLPRPALRGGKLIGSVLRVDRFGNIITNLRRTDLVPDFNLRIAGQPVTRWCSSFAEGVPGEVFAIEGSAGYVEIVMNQASAADRLQVQSGAEIEVESGSPNH